MTTHPKRSKRLCIVMECGNGDGMGLSLFKLPMNKERCIQWLKALDREDLIPKAMFRPHSYSVCYEHFGDGSFKKTLRNDAKPLDVRAKLQQKGLQNTLGLPRSQTTFDNQFRGYVSPGGRLDSERETSTGGPEPQTSHLQAQKTHSVSIGTQTGQQPEQPEEDTLSSQSSTDLILKERKHLEDARVAQYKYIRNFIRKKGLRKPNILLSHCCTEDNVCKKFCKLIENQKKS